MTTTKKSEDNFLAVAAGNESARGFEDMDATTVSVPFIKLLQALSPEINKKKEVYIEGAEEGMFVNSVTKDLMGKSFNAIVVGFERVYVEWLPNRGGFVAYHTPSEAEEITVSREWGKWATPEGNDLIETYMYRVLIEGKEHEGVSVISMTSSNITVAKAWNKQLLSTLLPDGQKALPHFMVWEIGSDYTEKKDNSWYKFSIKKTGFVNKEQYAVVTDQRKILDTKQVEYTGETKADKASVPEENKF